MKKLGYLRQSALTTKSKTGTAISIHRSRRLTQYTIGISLVTVISLPFDVSSTGLVSNALLVLELTPRFYYTSTTSVRHATSRLRALVQASFRFLRVPIFVVRVVLKMFRTLR